MSWKKKYEENWGRLGMRYKTYTMEDALEAIIDYRGKTPKKSEKGIPTLSAKSVKNNHIDYDSCYYISSGEYKRFMVRGLPQIGDVLLTTEAPLGMVAQLDRNDVGIAQRLLTLRGKQGILDNEYLLYYLQSPTGQALLRARETGTTVTGIKQSEFRKVQIDIPDIENQRKIGGILRRLDDKIAVNDNINKNLFEMVNAYYTSLFKDVECEMTTIGNYTERIYSGGTPTTSNVAYWGGGFGWFSSGETRNRFVISTDKTITQSGIDNSSTKLAAKYDIVMASAGQGFTRGQTSMLLIDAYVNQSVIVIHADRNIIPYLFWNLANRYEELRAISDSSSIRGSLTTKMIAAFEIPLANGKTIQNFSEFAWAVIPQIENNLLENERLAALRDSLLPKLMSGELDISNLDL